MRYWFIFILCTIFQVGMAQSLYEYRYWFDNDTQNSQSGQTNSADVHIDIDTSPLQSGLHTFNYQIVKSDKGGALPHSHHPSHRRRTRAQPAPLGHLQQGL